MPYKATSISSRHRGWHLDQINGRLAAVYNGTEVLDFDANDMAIAVATTLASGIVTGDLRINLTLTAGADGVGASGEQLTSGGAGAETTWTAAASLAESKYIGDQIDPDQTLERIMSVPVYKFHYRRHGEDGQRITTTGDYDTEYTGVLAEDLPEVMHHNGRIFSPVSAFGTLLAAVQSLATDVKELKEKIG